MRTWQVLCKRSTFMYEGLIRECSTETMDGPQPRSSLFSSVAHVSNEAPDTARNVPVVVPCCMYQ